MSTQRQSVFALLADVLGVSFAAAESLGVMLNFTIAALAKSRFIFAAGIVKAAFERDHVLRRFGLPAGRLIKGFEDKTTQQLAVTPLSAPEGISKPCERQLAGSLGVKTSPDLAQSLPFRAAREVLAGAVRGRLPMKRSISGIIETGH